MTRGLEEDIVSLELNEAVGGFAEALPYKQPSQSKSYEEPLRHHLKPIKPLNFVILHLFLSKVYEAASQAGGYLHT